MGVAFLISCQGCSNETVQSSCQKYFDNKFCPDCRQRKSNSKILTKFSESLWALNNKLAIQWSSSNFPLLPQDVAVQANSPFHFNCSACSTPFSATPNNRWRSKSTTCPQCSQSSVGQKNSVPRGKTVADQPMLMAQWAESNGEDPSGIAHRSNRKFWWTCSEGHNTLASVDSRMTGRGCRICAQHLYVSRPEKQLRNLIGEIYAGPLLFNSRNYSSPYEIDIMLPELMVGFEFNGNYYHSNQVVLETKKMTANSYHMRKRKLALVQGVRLYFVWELDFYRKRSQVSTSIEKIIEGFYSQPILEKLT
jgi:hypothetical protein